MLVIEELENEDTYDVTVPDTSCFFANNILVHNSEIILRIMQFCNLSEVVIRPQDTLQTILKKIELATVIGTLQATLTNFVYLNPKWKENTEEEALLGVSLTGIMDHPVFSGKDPNGFGITLEEVLQQMTDHAVEINKKWANKLGINPAAAITCTKPSGCTTLDTKIKTENGILSMSEIFSQLTNTNFFESKPHTWLTPLHPMKVYDENNELQLITKLFVNGIEDVYEVKMEDGNTYKFTGNHKLKTTNGWKRVDQLSEDDELIEF